MGSIIGRVIDAIQPTIETAFNFADGFWWFWLLIGALFLVRFELFVRSERRLVRSGIPDIDQMDGRPFEAQPTDAVRESRLPR